MSPDKLDWQKLVLAGGLLLLLAYGLLQIPEVRGWYAPEFIWEIKIDQLKKESFMIEKRLKKAKALLETLNDLQRKNPSLKVWDDRLDQVKKECNLVELRSKYFNAKLAALKVAVEGRIQGASPSAGPELNSLLSQIKEMELQGLQYNFALEYTLEKLRTVKLAGAKPSSGRVR